MHIDLAERIKEFEEQKMLLETVRQEHKSLNDEIESMKKEL